MNIFLPSHLDILSLFNDKGVRYLLIGGYAVIAHGYARTTGDLDLWIEPSNENKLILCDALESAGFDPFDLHTLKELDFTSYLVFSIGEEPQKIDFITRVNLVDFQEAFTNKIDFHNDNITLPLVRLQDLILMKINTGRSKDASDIEELQKISNRGKN